AKIQRRAHLEPRDRVAEIRLDRETGLEQGSATEDEQDAERDDQRHRDEKAESKVLLLVVHGRGSDFGMGGSGSRLKNWRTRESLLWSRSSAGLPVAIMLRDLGSSMTARSAIVKMLSSSWVTTTKVKPRFARRDRMV